MGLTGGMKHNKIHMMIASDGLPAAYVPFPRFFKGFPSAIDSDDLEDPHFIATDESEEDQVSPWSWSRDEVAFVSYDFDEYVGKENQPKENQPKEVEVVAGQCLGCRVPELVRMAGKGNLEKVLAALEAGEDPNVSDEMGLTALHAAAKKGHLEIVNLLLSLEADVNPIATEVQGTAPIHYASKYGHDNVLATLLKLVVMPH